MNKITKYGIIGGIVVACAALAYNAFMPKENSDLKEAPAKERKQQGQALNVRGVVIGEQLITDALAMSGSLVPDEEVSLSFETSGKITDIYFKEGSMVEKGQLLAKINDAPLQAELRRKEAQLRLMQDRVFRAKALLEKEAVSKEAFQEAEANIDINSVCRFECIGNILCGNRAVQTVIGASGGFDNNNNLFELCGKGLCFLSFGSNAVFQSLCLNLYIIERLCIGRFCKFTRNEEVLCISIGYFENLILFALSFYVN